MSQIYDNYPGGSNFIETPPKSRTQNSMRAIHRNRIYAILIGLVCAGISTQSSHAGGPSPNGDLEILFSDGGDGTTTITASGSGVTNNDSNNSAKVLGFFGNPDNSPNTDLMDLDTAITGDAPDFSAVMLTDTITLELSGVGNFELDSLSGNGADSSTPDFFGFLYSNGSGDPVLGSPRQLDVVDGTGSVPIDFSQFAALFGRSFASLDGFTFTFGQPLPKTSALADLQIGKKRNNLRGDNIYDTRKASKKQTIVYPRNFYRSSISKANLVLQNDGQTADSFQLRAAGDRGPGKSSFAKVVGGSNVSAALRTGRFLPTIEPGASVAVIYRLKTNAYAAKNSNTVLFRLTTGSSRDIARMINGYR